MMFAVPVTLVDWLAWTTVRVSLVGLFHLYSSNDVTVRPIPTAISYCEARLWFIRGVIPHI